MKTWRPVLFGGAAIASLGVLAYGLFREEIGEVLFNAAML